MSLYRWEALIFDSSVARNVSVLLDRHPLPRFREGVPFSRPMIPFQCPRYTYACLMFASFGLILLIVLPFFESLSCCCYLQCIIIFTLTYHPPFPLHYVLFVFQYWLWQGYSPHSPPLLRHRHQEKSTHSVLQLDVGTRWEMVRHTIVEDIVTVAGQ